MNQDHAEGTWDQIDRRAKKIWGELTDDNFKKTEGSMDKLGDTREAIKEKLDKRHLK